MSRAPRRWTVEESVIVPAPSGEVARAVADVRRMTRWSPELIAVFRRGNRFVGVNRRGPFVWFTTCRIVVETAEEFAFDVTSFGLPVARWGYRMSPVDGGSGGTELTEYWRDLRRSGWRRRVVELLGLVFTGTPPAARADVNRAGMRATLERIRADLGG